MPVFQDDLKKIPFLGSSETRIVRNHTRNTKRDNFFFSLYHNKGKKGKTRQGTKATIVCVTRSAPPGMGFESAIFKKFYRT